MTRLSCFVNAIAGLAITGPALAGVGEDLITAHKCVKCHTATSTKKGPSFASLAAQYKGNAATQARLVNVLKTGGKDDHAKVAATDAELSAIVSVVLAAP